MNEQEVIEERLKHVMAALSSLKDDIPALATNTGLGAMYTSMLNHGPKLGAVGGAAVTGGLMARAAYKAYKNSKNHEAWLKANDPTYNKNKMPYPSAVKLTKEDQEILENVYRDFIEPLELEEQNEYDGYSEESPYSHRDQILDIFKGSMTENPSNVESVFNSIIGDKIRDLIAQRKSEIAESMFGDDRPKTEEDDDYFPDEEEEEEDPFLDDELDETQKHSWELNAHRAYDPGGNKPKPKHGSPEHLQQFGKTLPEQIHGLTKFCKGMQKAGAEGRFSYDASLHRNSLSLLKKLKAKHQETTSKNDRE